MKVKLGDKYRDQVSGFEGTATAQYKYLNGCVRYELTSSTLHEGKPLAQVFDEEQLVKASTAKAPAHPRSSSGGPRSSSSPARR